jgi:hypothetical protein
MWCSFKNSTWLAMVNTINTTNLLNFVIVKVVSILNNLDIFVLQ